MGETRLIAILGKHYWLPHHMGGISLIAILGKHYWLPHHMGGISLIAILGKHYWLPHHMGGISLIAMKQRNSIATVGKTSLVAILKPDHINIICIKAWFPRIL